MSAMPARHVITAEVADSSLRYERTVKVPAYGAAGIPEAWLVDLGAGVVEVATSPSPRGYRQQIEAKAGEAITPVAVPGLAVPVDEV